MVEGDCAAVLERLEAPVDHCVMDAPYSEWVHDQEKKSGRRRDGTARLSPIGFDALSNELRSAVSGQCGRLVRRWCLVFADGESAHLWRQSFADAGLRHIRLGAWVKPDSSPQFSGDRPAAAFEAIQISHGAGERPRWNAGGKRGVWVYGIEREEREHDTPKPLPLMLDLIADFTDPDDLVLDPFAGSGTTGVACLRLGRRFLGVEKSPKYAALARERLEAESQGLTLRDARRGQLPLLVPG